jgi:hypothetical protein
MTLEVMIGYLSKVQDAEYDLKISDTKEKNFTVNATKATTAFIETGSLGIDNCTGLNGGISREST